MPKNLSKNAVCKFCAIVQKKQTAFLIYEDKNSLAFLDHRPVFLGHCLLIPKKHYLTLNDLPKNTIKSIFTNVQKLTQAITKAMQAEGAFVAINNKVSQSVPHFHVHIIPRKHGDGLRGFFWPRQKYRNEKQLQEIQRKIKKAWKQFQSSAKSFSIVPKN